MSVLLDSDVVISALRGRPRESETLKQLFETGERLYFSPVTRAEVFAGMMPVMIQLAFMATLHGTWTVSEIGAVTLKSYLAARVYGEVESIAQPLVDGRTLRIDVHDARERLAPLDEQQIVAYLFDHPVWTARVWHEP